MVTLKRITNALLLTCFVVVVSCSGGGDGPDTRLDVIGRGIIPDVPPEGFALVDSLRYYGTKGAPLSDGTIFDYINGGGVVYLDHGLVAAEHARYGNSDGDELIVDIFDMRTTENAASAFADEQICPEGFTTVDIGRGGKAYNYVPDYMIYFHASRYLVNITTTNDYLREDIMAFAKRLAGNIN